MECRRNAIAAVALAGLVGLAPAIGAAQAPEHLWVPGADPVRGRQLVLDYGCGACHTIPNAPGARGIVGPNLERFAERTILAGVMANAPRNLVAWLIDPPAIAPETAMPNMGLSEEEARDIAAFLYTLGARAAAESVRPEDAAPTGGDDGSEDRTVAADDGIPVERAMEMLSNHPPNTPRPSVVAD